MVGSAGAAFGSGFDFQGVEGDVELAVFLPAVGFEFVEAEGLVDEGGTEGASMRLSSKMSWLRRKGGRMSLNR